MKYLTFAVMLCCSVTLCLAVSFAQAPVAGTAAFGPAPLTGPGGPVVGAGCFPSCSHADPGLLSPRFFVGWSRNASSIKLGATASAYVDEINNMYGDGSIVWSTNGLWLGVSLPWQISDRFATDLQGWYFVPANKHVEVSASGTTLSDGDPSSGSIRGNLNVSTTWFACDLEGSYWTHAHFAVLAGVRYDYLQGTISLPQSLQDIANNDLPGFRAKLDLNLNSFFPSGGFKSLRPAGQGSLTFSVKGFPWAVSVADVHPKSGYFAEVFCSYDVMPSLNFSLSLFGKAQVAHAVFEELSQVGNIFNKDLSIPPETPVNQSLPVTWQQYIIGGAATFYFNLSMP
jgi:hypothetical protein